MSDNVFSSKIFEISCHGVLGMAMGLGQQLRLFDVLAEVSAPGKPATSKEVAERANMKERYVKEWLCCMACGNIIEVDESGDHFWMKPEQAAELTGPNPNAMLVFQAFLPLYADIFPQMLEVFKKDGPLGTDYSNYAGFHKHMSSFSQSVHKKHLLTDYLSLVGVRDLLEEGISVLDVGCGDGFHVVEFATHFPKSHFTGIDISPVAISQANQRKESSAAACNNVVFLEMNAGKVKEEWTSKFEYVTIFDACHDQRRPDLCVREIYRVLKPGGVFALIEVEGSSNAYIDKKLGGLQSSLFYGVSLFHCLPIGSNSEDALCMGAMWGRERAVRLLKDAGFEKIDVIPTPFFKSNVLYLCKK